MIPFLFHLCACVSSLKPGAPSPYLGFQGAIVFSNPYFHFLGTPALQTFKFIFCAIYTLPLSSLSNELSRPALRVEAPIYLEAFHARHLSKRLHKSTPSCSTEADEPISFTGKGCGPGRDFSHGLPADGVYDPKQRFLVSGKHESVS
jgi:hypothetical protein